MKKKTLIFLMIGIFILLIIINSFLPEKSNENKSSLELKEPEFSSPKIEEVYFKVTYVVDGDTIEIETGERVRLICIDTPEKGEEGYNEAKDYLEDLILYKEVKLEKDISETDKYDRLLRHIYLEDGTFVNELMVREGYAEAYPYKPDITLCPQIENAEDYAKEYELGIWEKEEEEQEPEVEEEPEEESEPEEEEEPEGSCQCSIDLDCGDFSTQSQAQSCYEYCLSIKGTDFHRLDGDDDGIACESLGY